MFEFLRRLIVPIIIIVLVFFVAMIVLQWGADITRSQRADDTVGVIDGEEISYRIFEQYYSNLIRAEQDKTEEELTPAKMDELRDRAWAQLLSDVLLRKEIEKRRITVTDEEVYEFLKLYPPSELQSAPQFMTDGKFDYQKYINAMVSPENAPFWAQLELYVQPDLLRSKLQVEIISTVRVTPWEIMEAYLEEKEQAKIGYINIPAASFPTPTEPPSEEESREYYKSHKENYRLSNRATADVVLFNKDASENDWDRAYYEIKEIYDSAVAGIDFGELAQAYSEDNSASAGGDLGWFGRGRMVPEFDSATWALNVDEISQPVRSRFGWHVIKLLGIRTDEETPPGSDKPQQVEKRHAAHILLKVAPSQETLDELFTNARDFADAAREIGLKEATEEYNFEVKTTQPFTEAGYVPFLGQDPDACGFTFENEVGKVSEVMENSSAYYVISVASHLPEGYTPFEETRPSIERTLLADMARQMAYDTAVVIHKAIADGMAFSAAGKKYGFAYQLSDLITRKSVLPGIGRAAEPIGAAFALENVNTISDPVEYDRGAVIITLLEKISPGLEEFNRVQDSIQFAIQLQKSQDMYNRWFDNMVKAAKVENYLDKFYRRY